MVSGLLCQMEYSCSSKGGTLYKTIGMLMILIAVAGSAMAVTAVPEIDGSSAVSAVALLSGGFLMIRGRKR